MKTKYILFFYLTVMATLIALGLFYSPTLSAWLYRPDWYLHAKFTHILCVTLFFGNVVIGTLWETRSLLSNDSQIIRYTYRTVTWLDAFFTAPLILISLISGLMLGTVLGGVWTLPWLSRAFLLFLFSGAVWIAADIPTQYKINRLFRDIRDDEPPPPKLLRWLWFRVGLNIFAIVPLLMVFFLMVHKP